MLTKIEKSWNDFWGYYWRIEDRHSIPGIFEWDSKLVDFIEHVCKLKKGDHIVDLACGGGDQAKVFAGRGYTVTGVDIVPSLIEFAEKQFEKENLKGTFTTGDMRKIKYSSKFDACLILSGSFGFFSDRENIDLLLSVNKALKAGGKLFIMFHSPNEFRAKKEKTWKESKNGWSLTESWFDMEKSALCTKNIIIKKDGTLIVPKVEPGNYYADEVIRCYTLPEIKNLLKNTGFNYSGSYSSYNLSLPLKELKAGDIRNIIVGEKKD